MTLSTVPQSDNYLVLQMPPVWEMSADNFFDFCQLNSHLRIERNATGKLIIMSPAGSETGNRNFKLIQQLANWTDQDGTGIGFDSSAGFILPNGATRSPDASWINLTRWNSLSADTADELNIRPKRRSLQSAKLSFFSFSRRFTRFLLFSIGRSRTKSF